MLYEVITILGLIALAFPQVLGVGYGVTDLAIRGQLTFELLISLLFIKIFATAMCLGFGPSMWMIARNNFV